MGERARETTEDRHRDGDRENEIETETAKRWERRENSNDINATGRTRKGAINWGGEENVSISLTS